MALPAAARAKADRAIALIAGSGKPPAAAPAPDPTPPAAAGEEDAATLRLQLDKARNAVLSLQGKVDAELPRYAEQLKVANDKVAELQELIEKRGEPVDITITDDEKRLLGVDMVSVVTKLVQQGAEKVVNGKLKPLTERLNAYDRMTEAQFRATMDYHVPGWLVQNDDPKFVTWLDDIDPTSHRTRYDLLQRAYGAFQGYRVVEIFRAFKEGREIGALAPAAPSKPNIDPPPGGGQPLSPDQPQGRIWTRAQIKQLFVDKRAGKYTKAEAHALEVDISKAAGEGRVQG